VELAYALRQPELGADVGINLRVASNAGVDGDLLDRLRPVLHEFARRRASALVPLPIAHHSAAADAQTIRRLLAGFDDAATGGTELDSPQKVIAQVARCRVVVTGAYHAAVFALAQGIPAVCLSGSAYYADKFRGLRDLFGDGCRIVWLDEGSAAADLATELNAAWESAERVRAPLLRAAERQIAWGRAALARVAAIGAGAVTERDDASSVVRRS
jgi:polysaccharide pyruvyl transferase WcaK-like protein